MASPAHEAVAGCPAPSAISLMGVTMVVELQAAIQGDLRLAGSGGEPPAELDSPQLLQDGPMQPLHEAGRPGMPRLSAGVADTPFAAGLVEPAAKLVALIGQEPLDLPARFLEGRHHTPSQEVGRGGRREVEADLGDAVGASRIAGCVLTDLSRALVFADLERVQANQFPGFARLNVRRLAALSGAQHTPGAFGQEPRRLSTLGFEHRQALAASLQAGSSQQAVGGAGGHLPAAVFGQAKLESPLHGPPGRPGDRQGQNGSCGLRTQHRRPTGASGQAPGGTGQPGP